MPSSPLARRAGALGVVLALLGGGCTQHDRAVRVRRASSTTVEVVTGKVTGRDEPGAEQTTPDRFDVGKDASVLVPIGALGKGVELRVTRSGAAAIGIGAIEGGATRFEVATTGGTLHKPIAVQVDVIPAADQSRPVAIVHDDATGTWQPVSADYAAGSLTIYAPRTGSYSWVRWNWRTAADIAGQTARTATGTGPSGAPALSCPAQDQTVATVTATPAAPPTDGALRWCVGGTAARPELQVGNASTVPLALMVTGVPGATASSGLALVDDVATAARGVPGMSTDGAVGVLVPGATARLDLDPAGTARATLGQNGFSRAVVTLAAALGAAVGLRAGTVDAAAAVLARAEVRRAALADLTAPACAERLGVSLADANSGETGAAIDRLTGCLTAATSALVAEAAAATLPLRRAFSTEALAAPATTTATVAEALLAGVRPLFASSRGGEVVVEPRPPGGVAVATPTVVPAQPTPTVVVTPAGATASATTTTVGRRPDATTTTARPTTTTTRPAAVPTPTTRAAPPVTTAPTTTGPAPVTAPAPVTTPAPTTTSPGPVTTPPITVGPTTPAPVTELSNDRCSRDRGSITLTTTGLTASGPYTVLLTAPDRRVTTTALVATPTGATDDIVSCDGARRGTWRVVVRDDSTGLASTELTYTVR